jgi:NAD(P)-dependent dehydrogenase (short-subunit alcohol dehydrogenase family)
VSEATSRDDRTIVITGASSGIGRVTAVSLARAGARVAVVGRNLERTRDVARAAGGIPFVADFDRLDEVRRLAGDLASLGPIDVLVNNAGGLVTHRQVTVDGNERTFQANHLAPFLLTRLLLDAPAGRSLTRVISTASSAHRYGRLRLDDLTWADRPWHGGWGAYGASKLATILFIQELARRTAGRGLGAYAVHPGVVATGFGRDVRAIRLASRLTAGHYARSAASGAAPLIALARSEPEAPSGTYYDRMRPGARLAHRAKGPAADLLARDLWHVSAELVGVEDDM